MLRATTIQERLWELRKDKGLNLEELAQQGKRQAEGMGRTLQCQAQGPGGGSKGRDPGRGYGKRRFYPRQPVTQAGAAQGHRIG